MSISGKTNGARTTLELSGPKQLSDRRPCVACQGVQVRAGRLAWWGMQNQGSAPRVLASSSMCSSGTPPWYDRSPTCMPMPSHARRTQRHARPAGLDCAFQQRSRSYHTSAWKRCSDPSSRPTSPRAGKPLKDVYRSRALPCRAGCWGIVYCYPSGEEIGRRRHDLAGDMPFPVNQNYCTARELTARLKSKERPPCPKARPGYTRPTQQAVQLLRGQVCALRHALYTAHSPAGPAGDIN